MSFHYFLSRRAAQLVLYRFDIYFISHLIGYPLAKTFTRPRFPFLDRLLQVWRKAYHLVQKLYFRRRLSATCYKVSAVEFAVNV